MKAIFKFLIAGATMSISVAGFAQSNGIATRLQVRQQLIKLENTGFSTDANDPHYPNDLEAAEAKTSHPRHVLARTGNPSAS